MGANSTLVDAAFKLGASEAAVAVPNMKPLYDSNLAIAEKAFGVLTGAVDGIKKQQETIRIARDKQLKGFTSIADETYAKLYTMDEGLPEKVVTALRNEIESLQTDFEKYNTYGKNDTKENNAARTRITSELKRITNSVTGTRTAFMAISGDAKDWNRNRIDPDNIATLQSFLNIKDMDMNDNVTVEYVRGELTFTNTDTGKSFTAKEMRKAVPSVDKNIQTFSTKRVGDAQAAGKTDGYDGVKNRYSRPEVISSVKSEYMSEILTDEDFMNAATIETVGGVQAFKLALMDHEAIPIEIIKHMYYTEDGENVPLGEIFAKFDKVDDGVIDSKDVAKMNPQELILFEENHKRMISALTNIYDDAFDLQTSKSLFADYAVDAEKQAYNRFYTEESTKRETKELTASEKARKKAEALKASQYQIGGPSAKVRNPATGLLEPTGYKYDKNGNLLFDDSEFLKNIQTGIQTKDYFGNTYKPVIRNGKMVGYNIFDAIGKDKYVTFKTADQVLGFGYQAGLKVDFDPNSYKK